MQLDIFYEGLSCLHIKVPGNQDGCRFVEWIYGSRCMYCIREMAKLIPVLWLVIIDMKCNYSLYGAIYGLWTAMTFCFPLMQFVVYDNKVWLPLAGLYLIMIPNWRRYILHKLH